MEESIFKVILSCAGIGSRMYPITKILPKELLPIINTPIIDYIFQELYAFKDFIIVINDQKKQLVEYIEHHACYNKNITYVKQIEGKYGTNVVIQSTKNVVNNHPLFLALPDVIVDDDKYVKDMVKTYHEHGKGVLLLQRASYPEEVTLRGVVSYSHVSNNIYFINAIVEKPNIEKAPSNLCCVGRYILPPSIFEYTDNVPITKGEYMLTNAIEQLIKSEGMVGIVTDANIFDVGVPHEYVKTINYFSKLTN